MDSEVQKKVVYMPTKGALGCCCFLPFQNLCTHCEPEYSAPQVCACQSWDVDVCVYDPQEREVRVRVSQKWKRVLPYTTATAILQ